MGFSTAGVIAQWADARTMIYHRYPLRSLIWDYCRAGAGLTFALVPLILGAPGLFFTTVLGILALLFFLYGMRTANQHMTAYEVRDEGIASHGPKRRFFGWSDMEKVQLRYYSTQRDKNRRDLSRGWMELKINSPEGTLRIDSEVEGFDVILTAVAEAVEKHEIELDETTRDNFKAFSGGPPEPGGIGAG